MTVPASWRRRHAAWTVTTGTSARTGAPRSETTYCVGVIENDGKRVSETAKESRD